MLNLTYYTDSGDTFTCGRCGTSFSVFKWFTLHKASCRESRRDPESRILVRITPKDTSTPAVSPPKSRPLKIKPAQPIGGVPDDDSKGREVVVTSKADSSNTSLDIGKVAFPGSLDLADISGDSSSETFGNDVFTNQLLLTSDIYRIVNGEVDTLANVVGPSLLSSGDDSTPTTSIKVDDLTTFNDSLLGLDTSGTNLTASGELIITAPGAPVRKIPILPSIVLTSHSESQTSAEVGRFRKLRPKSDLAWSEESLQMGENVTSPYRKKKKRPDTTLVRNKCETCGKQFFQLSDFLKHARIHSAVKPFACYYCGRRFNQRSNGKKHVFSHAVFLEDTKKRVLLPEPDGNPANIAPSFKDSKSSIDISELKNTYACQRCDAKCENYLALRNHMKKHAKEKVFVCPLETCGKVIQTVDEFMDHLVPHAKAGLMLYPCEKCGQEFNAVAKLADHESQGCVPELVGTSSQGDRHGKWKCQLCKSQFRSEASLEDHMRTWTHEYFCPMDDCGKRFKMERSLRAHLVSHAGKVTSLSKFPCDICGKVFLRRSNLNYHRKIHLKTDKYSCAQCGAEFGRKSNLARHELLHSEVAALYECPFKESLGCGKTFLRKDKLRIHAEKHMYAEKETT